MGCLGTYLKLDFHLRLLIDSLGYVVTPVFLVNGVEIREPMVEESGPLLSVWGQLILFFSILMFMPDLACYQKVWVKAFYCPKMSL